MLMFMKKNSLSSKILLLNKMLQVVVSHLHCCHDCWEPKSKPEFDYLHFPQCYQVCGDWETKNIAMV